MKSLFIVSLLVGSTFSASFSTPSAAAISEDEQTVENLQVVTKIKTTQLADLPVEIFREIASYGAGILCSLASTCKTLKSILPQVNLKSAELANRMALESLQYVPHHRDLEAFNELNFAHLPHGRQKALKFAIKSLHLFENSPCYKELRFALYHEITKYMSTEADTKTKPQWFSRVGHIYSEAFFSVFLETGRFKEAEEFSKNTMFCHCLVTEEVASLLIEYIKLHPESIENFYRTLSNEFWIAALETKMPEKEFVELAWPLPVKGEQSRERTRVTMKLFVEILFDASAEWIAKPTVNSKLRALFKRIKKSHCNSNLEMHGLHFLLKKAARCWGLTDEVAVLEKNVLYLPEDFFKILWKAGKLEEMIQDMIGMNNTGCSLDPGMADKDAFIDYLYTRRDIPAITAFLLFNKKFFSDRLNMVLELADKPSLEALVLDPATTYFNYASVFHIHGTAAIYETLFNRTQYIPALVEMVMEFLKGFNGPEANFFDILRFSLDRLQAEEEAVQYFAASQKVAISKRNILLLFKRPDMAERVLVIFRTSSLMLKSTILELLADPIAVQILKSNKYLAGKFFARSDERSSFTLTESESLAQVVDAEFLTCNFNNLKFEDLNVAATASYAYFKTGSDLYLKAAHNIISQDPRTLREVAGLYRQSQPSNFSDLISSLPAMHPNRLRLLRLALHISMEREEGRAVSLSQILDQGDAEVAIEN